MSREVIEVPVASLANGDRVALMSVEEYVRLRDMEAKYWSQVGELRTANSTVNFLRGRLLELHAQLRSAGVPEHVVDRVGASGPFFKSALELADPETIEKLALQEEIARLMGAIKRIVRADEELEFDAISRQYPSEDAWKEFHDAMGVLREIAREGR